MPKIPRYIAPITVNGRTYTPAELEARDRAAYTAADLLASGYKPKPSDLAEAPRIEDWQLKSGRGPDGVEFRRLHGMAIGHPLRRMPHPIQTSLIIAIDEEAGWARSYSRFYRLGTKRDTSLNFEPIATLPWGEDKGRVQTEAEKEAAIRGMLAPPEDEEDDDEENAWLSKP